MSIEVKVPVLPESVSDATVATWHKKPGDFVHRDENLVDLETDKVVLEVPAPADGVLKSILKPEGETVLAEEVLGIVEEGEVPAAGETKPQASAESQKADTPSPADEEKIAATVAPVNTGKASPSARKLMEENALDASQVAASGRSGRITKPDVLRAMGSAPALPAEERVKMSRLRKKIADRMVEAQHTAAMLTSFNEVDLKAVMDIRKKYKEQFQEKHGVKLGLMSFFVKAATEALRKHPIVNASVEGDEIVYHNTQNISIAVATDRGLVVPVLRDTANMSLADIEHAIREYAIKAREGKLAMEDLQGGTFTITNGGTFGSLLSTPILNSPQSAILGMHAIKERPVVIDGQIVARPMMYIALTYDHRIIDGKDAVLFLVDLKNALEDPARLLLNL